MKKFTTLCLATVVAGTAFAQRPQAQQKAVASHAQITKVATYDAKLQQILGAKTQESMLKAYPVSSGAPTFSPNGKVAAVSPVQLGTASNIFTILTTEQNQVVTNNDFSMVSFIHRNDATTFGGSSGNLRYDFSIDGGASFSNDIGNLNPLLSRPARYPNTTAHYPSTAASPFDGHLVHYSAVLNPSPDWDGHLAGVCDMGSANNATENYVQLSTGAYIPGGLCEGLPGEFWSVDRDYTGAAFSGNFYVNKGVWNSGTGDVDWTRVATVTPNHSFVDGSPVIIGPNISFSPDGQTGWIAWCGDLAGGPDSTLQPIFMKSTDGGATWGSPVEFDLATIPWVKDSLQTLWVDSLMNPASKGRSTTAFDFDLVVDNQGNPHMGVVIGSGDPSSGTSYSIQSGLAKFMADIWTPDGGTTWDVAYISPVLAFRGTFGTGDGVTMDNFAQIARNPLGNVIFYSWVDSDTAQFTGSMNGIGFGESDNIAPNLRTAARKPYTNEQTYPQLVTDGDLVWEGRALFPTMAPVVLFQGGQWNLPIVIAEMITNDPLAQTQFWYLGNDATVENTAGSFCFYPSMALSWDVIGSGATPPCAVSNDQLDGADQVVLGQSYPNPTANEAYIVFELPAATQVTMTLTNMYGQQVGTLVNSEMTAGTHKVTVDTRNFAAGVYFYTLEANGNAQTKKMIVSK